MSLTPGTRIGPYEIAAQIGVGGMGEVYRAVDSNLGRSVAIKVLPDIFSQDPDRLARFEREAKTLASLNHLNIAQVFGLEKGTSEGGQQTQALVMELVEGPTLADRIAQGAIPLDEAVPIAIQIAEALETAHDQGIVHRDLKPANVKVRADGIVKVLDFGLAKAMAPAGEIQSGTLANSPTITSPAMTQAGVVLGTAAYMSPEQAKGRAVDRRADIWSFGCLLFEMLTAKRAFAGDDISDVLVAILRDEPPWPALPATTPPHIRLLMRRCLQKDPKKRLPHIGVARLELAEDTTPEGAVAMAPAARRGRALEGLAWMLAGAAVAVILAWQFSTRDPNPTAMLRFEIQPPTGGVLPGGQSVPRFAVSPDGQSVVYQAAGSGGNAQLWLRRLADVDARPMPNTESFANDLSSQQAFWSHDGRHIGFFDENARKLKKLDLQSGGVQSLGDLVGNQYGGSWNADGVILMSTASSNGVQRISAAGGAASLVTTVDQSRREQHLWPEFLPDGRHFLYLATYAGETPWAIFVASLDGAAPKRLLESPYMARFAAPDRLLFVRDNALVAQRFDPERLELSGEPVLVVNDVLRTTSGRVAVSASLTGVLAYAAGEAVIDAAEAVWVDRKGNEVNANDPAIPMAPLGFRLSPDGKLLAFIRGLTMASSEIWLYDITRKIPTRLTPDSTFTDVAPVFSPDSSRVIFRRELGGGVFALREQPVSGASPGEEILRGEAGQLMNPLDWSIDGQLVYGAVQGSERGLWMMSLAGDRKPTPYLTSNSGTRGAAAISPNGRFLAYALNLGGSRQVFVQTFPDVSIGKWPVSKPGAGYPRWRRDGREIFFVDETGRLSAAPITTEPRFELGEATPLFQIPFTASAQVAQIYPYDVSPDGQRFIILRKRGASKPAALTVAVNWMTALPDR